MVFSFFFASTVPVCSPPHNLRSLHYIRDKIASNDNGWNSIPMSLSNIPTRFQGQASIAAVDFKTASVWHFISS
jgi:hypothetical protein